eukprot:SAG31_NODE_30708_length_377_cov_0.744604_1_plen_120_part_10
MVVQDEKDATRWLDNLRQMAPPECSHTEHRPGDKKLSKKGKDEAIKEQLEVARAAALRVADHDEAQRIKVQLAKTEDARKQLWSELDDLITSVTRLLLETSKVTGWTASAEDIIFLKKCQ